MKRPDDPEPIFAHAKSSRSSVATPRCELFPVMARRVYHGTVEHQHHGADYEAYLRIEWSNVILTEAIAPRRSLFARRAVERTRGMDPEPMGRGIQSLCLRDWLHETVSEAKTKINEVLLPSTPTMQHMISSFSKIVYRR